MRVAAGGRGDWRAAGRYLRGAFPHSTLSFGFIRGALALYGAGTLPARWGGFLQAAPCMGVFSGGTGEGAFAG